MEDTDKLGLPIPAPRKSPSNNVAAKNTVSSPLQSRLVSLVGHNIKSEDVKRVMRSGSTLEEIDNIPQVSTTKQQNPVDVASKQHSFRNVVNRTLCQKNGRVMSKKTKPAPPPPRCVQENDKSEFYKSEDCVAGRVPVDSSTNQTQVGYLETTEKTAQQDDVLEEVELSLHESIPQAPPTVRSTFRAHITEKISLKDVGIEKIREEAPQLEHHPSAGEHKRFREIYDETPVLFEVAHGSKMSEKSNATSGVYLKDGRCPPGTPAIKGFASSPLKVENAAVQQECLDICGMNNSAAAAILKSAYIHFDENTTSGTCEKNILSETFRIECTETVLQGNPIPRPRRKKRYDELVQASVETGAPMLPKTKDTAIPLPNGVHAGRVGQVEEHNGTVDNKLNISAEESEGLGINSDQQNRCIEDFVKEQHDVVCDNECSDDVETTRL